MKSQNVKRAKRSRAGKSQSRKEPEVRGDKRSGAGKSRIHEDQVSIPVARTELERTRAKNSRSHKEPVYL
jgi:hypothetical protein